MRRVGKWCVIFLSFLAVTAIPLGIRVYWQRKVAAQELTEVLTQLDAEEPDWRLEQIEAKRLTVPDGKNGALVVMTAGQLLPKGWQSKLVEGELGKTPPPARLPEELAQKLRDELNGAEDALVMARTLVNYPQGRFPITYSPDFINTRVPELQNARLVAALLQLDVYAHIHNGQWNAAWQSSKALLNTNRAIGDEPLLISVLVRLALQGLTVQCLERTLGHGAIAADELLAMQTELAREADVSLFLVGMRGERAGTHQMLSNLENGDLPIAVAMESWPTGRPPPAAGWWDHFNDFFARKMAYRSHAWLVRFHTEVIEAAGKPVAERYHALLDLEVASKEFFVQGDNDFILARLLAAGVRKVAEAERRMDTQVHCAGAALAAERFRLKFERWPESLDELVQEKFLDAVRVDLFDARPVRFRRTADGVVVHSIGKDGGTYSGDALDRLPDFDPQQIRVEFRLWDPARRRQPPVPKLDEDK